MNGFINVDKEEGASSAREVAKIKRLTGERCGHMGTLDPMATGVLPVAIGNAARLFDYFLSKTKTYTAVFKFGTKSDTLDTTGNLTLNCGYVPTAEQIKSVLSRFIGKIEQIPPKFSAKNVNGTRGYKLAREGVEFELPPKTVEIFSVELLGEAPPDGYIFKIECGGGTYIRSIARDMGEALGTCAVMSRLRRTQSGCFTEKSAVRTCELTAQNISDYLIKTQDVLSFESIYPDAQDAKKLFNGMAVPTSYRDGLYKIYDGEKNFYGIAAVRNKLLKVKTKLC